MAQVAPIQIEIDTPNADEILAMAWVLARRHGTAAPGVAHHFAAEHDAVGDGTRAALWRRVAGILEAGWQPTLS